VRRVCKGTRITEFAFPDFSEKPSSFLEIIADGRAALAHRRPRDVAGWSMVASGGVVRVTRARSAGAYLRAEGQAERKALLGASTARKAKVRVKEQLKADGLKPAEFSYKEITLMADDYCNAHRAELEAWASWVLR